MRLHIKGIPRYHDQNCKHNHNCILNLCPCLLQNQYTPGPCIQNLDHFFYSLLTFRFSFVSSFIFFNTCGQTPQTLKIGKKDLSNLKLHGLSCPHNRSKKGKIENSYAQSSHPSNPIAPTVPQFLG